MLIVAAPSFGSDAIDVNASRARRLGFGNGSVDSTACDSSWPSPKPSSKPPGAPDAPPWSSRHEPCNAHHRSRPVGLRPRAGGDKLVPLHRGPRCGAGTLEAGSRAQPNPMWCHSGRLGTGFVSSRFGGAPSRKRRPISLRRTRRSQGQRPQARRRRHPKFAYFIVAVGGSIGVARRPVLRNLTGRVFEVPQARAFEAPNRSRVAPAIHRSRFRPRRAIWATVGITKTAPDLRCP